MGGGISSGIEMLALSVKRLLIDVIVRRIYSLSLLRKSRGESARYSRKNVVYPVKDPRRSRNAY